jgi:hypothetical protein
MAATSSREEADMIAVFASTIRNHLGPAVPGVEMNIFQPNSDHPVFTSRPVPNPDAGATVNSPRDDQWTARQYVLNLEGRIANTRIGLITLSPPIQ